MKIQRNSLIPALAVLLLPLLSGCAYTSTLYSPIDASEANADLAARLVGSWQGELEEGKTPVKVEITVDDSGKLLKIRGETMEKGQYLPLMPITGMMKTLDGRDLLCAGPDVDQMIADSRYAPCSSLQVLPRYYLFRITVEEDVLKVAIVTLATYEEDEKKFKPIDFSLRMAGAVVLNESEELNDTLARGHFKAEPFATLKRK